MERLAAKKGQGVLDVLQKGPAASEEKILSADESISFDEKRRKRAPKRAEFEPANVASISDTGDLRAVDYLNLPKPVIEDPRSMSPSQRRLRQEQIAAEATSHPFYRDEDNFTEKIQRSIDLDEIRGAKGPETELREVTLGEDSREYAKQYSKLASENPNMSETELQDATIKAVREKQAEDAAFYASKFDDVDYGDEMENEARRQRLAEEAEAAKKKDTGMAKAAADTIKKGRGGTTPKQPTAAELAARKAAEEERRRAEEERRRAEEERQQKAELAETTTEKSIEEDEEEAEKITELAVRDSAAKEAFDAGFANVRMPGLRKQSSELYNSFDTAYRSMYPSQEEMNQYPGARRRLLQRRNALDTIKNKLFRSSPDQWGNRPYGTGMNFEDAMKELEDELPTAAKEIRKMANRMRGFHILMNRYGEDAQLKGAFDLENLLRNTRLRGDKPLEEPGEVLRPIRTEGSLDESPSEEIIAAAAAEGV